MDLQNTFYALGILFMSMGLVVLIGMAVLLFYTFKKIGELQKQIQGKIDYITTNPAELASNFGASLLTSTYRKVRRALRH